MNLPLNTIDLLNQKFGSWTVINYIEQQHVNNSIYTIWLIRCVCGNERTIRSTKLRSKNKPPYCSKCKIIQPDIPISQRATKNKPPPEIGSTFGRLTVIAHTKINNQHINICKCNCGSEKLLKVISAPLRYGSPKSCGCLSREASSKRMKENNPGVKNTLPVDVRSLHILYRRYKANARLVGVSFDLTKNAFHVLISKNCNYCNCAPTFTDTKNVKLSYNGIDRIDNSLGYTDTNTVTCCKICNWAKGKTSLAGFINYIDRIVSFYNTPIPHKIYKLRIRRITKIRPLKLMIFRALRAYKFSAHYRNLVWELSDVKFKELLATSCYYCGSPPEDHIMKVRGLVFKRNGIDRKDNAIGYTVDNSVSCCSTCNRTKNAMPHDKFLNWIAALSTVFNQY